MANLAYELLNEGMLTDEPDIYYNIRDLEADKINLCFILYLKLYPLKSLTKLV